MTRDERGGATPAGSWWTLLIIVPAVALAAYTLSLFDFFEALEFKLYDLNFQLRGPRPVEEIDIAIVAIDEETSDSLSFPFNRCHYAELIRRLNHLGASLIVFDIDFSSVGIIPKSDSLFYAAIQEAGNVLHQGKITYIHKRGLRESIASVKPPVSQVSPPGTPWGLINELVDADGVSRRYSLFLPVADTAYVSLGLKVYSILHKLQVDKGSFNLAGNFHYGDLRIPRSPLDRSSTLINYYGPAGTFPTYSFVSVIRGDYDFEDLLAGLTPEEAEMLAASGMADILSENPFNGKVVLVGASDENLQDNKFTPFFTADNPRLTPGVEVHANALQMLADESFIQPIGFWWVIVGVLLLSILTYLSGRYLAQWLGSIGALFLIGVVVVGALMLFARQELWLREMPLLLTVAIGYPTNLVYRFVLAQREKAMIRGMFAQYVPKKVVGELIANPDMLKLGGEKRRMSVLFTDVAGFTTVSEQLSPEELVALLNEYLTAMTRVILDHEGIVDKYEGDLVMAEFGAPIWHEDHAALCCRAALGMQARLKELRAKWRAEGGVELYSRVGINSGEMIVGNMGSEEVFDYTVMGDSVNLASRLEGANKNYDTTIMIGRGTWDDVNQKFVTRPLDLLRVKGKLKPVEVFELVAELGDATPPGKLKAIELFEQGLERYRHMLFLEAGELFARAIEADPEDGPSRIYSERCSLYINEPPPSDWNGVWTLTEK